MGSFRVPGLLAGSTDDPLTAVRADGRVTHDIVRRRLSLHDGITPGGRSIQAGYSYPEAPAILRATGDALDGLPRSIQLLASGGRVFGDGITDMTTRLQQAVNSGARHILVPPDVGDYIVAGSVAIPAGIRIVGLRGHRLKQMIKHFPMLDAVGIDDLVFEDLNLTFDPSTFVKDTSAAGADYRFDQQYGLTTGIYISGNRCKVRRCRITGAIIAVNLNSYYNGGIAADRQDNEVDGLIVTAGQQGVLAKGQNNFTIRNVFARGMVVPPNTSGGADDPQHVIYCTGVAGYRNSRASISGIHAQDVSGSSAIQMKYVDGFTLSDVFTDNCAVLNLYDCHDGTGENVAATNCEDLGGIGGLAVSFGNEQTPGTQSSRISLTNLRFNMKPTVTRCATFFGDNITVRNAVWNVPVAVDSGATAISVAGQQNDIDCEVNFAAGFGMLACQVRTAGVPVITTDDNDIRIRTRGARGILSTDVGVTNTRFVYDPATLTPKAGFVGIQGDAGTGTVLKRTAHEVVTSHAGGGSITMTEPALCTRRTIKIGDGSAYTITAPANLAAQPDGTTIEIAISNGTAGALGAITWNAVYKFNGAFAAPGAGLGARFTFRYDKASGTMVQL